ncbi:hypothetical protein ACT009_01330 [Sphingomonas sp. Tas61C01]|uniref:hypothetical protein n=1 Tax=Sphingomonas sp. Tas61C01 TaxID=3458297 RepID=UPI00403E451F
MTAARASHGPLPVRAAFAAAAFSRGLTRCFADMFLGYHLHARAGLSSAETGATLLVLLSAGALADVAAGLLLRRWRSRARAVFVMQRIGAIFAAVALVPLFLPEIGMIGALFWGSAFRIAFSFYTVPQTTLLSILPEDAGERRLFVTLHTALGAFARLVTAATAFLIVDAVDPARSAIHLGWVVALASFGVVTVLLLELAVGARPTVSTLPSDPADDRGWPAGLTWLLATTLFHASALFMMSRLFLFAPQADGATVSGPWVLTAWTCGLTAGPFLWGRCRRLSFPVAVAVAAIAASVLLMSGLPLPVKLIAACGYGIGLGASGAELIGAIGHLVRKGSGASAGMAFAAFAFVTKIAMAAGNGALAFILDGYAADERSTLALLATINLVGGLSCALAWRRAKRAPGDRVMDPAACRRA